MDEESGESMDEDEVTVVYMKMNVRGRETGARLSEREAAGS